MFKRFWLFCACLILLFDALSAFAFPQLTGVVVDDANILSEEQKNQLKDILKKAEPHKVVAVSVSSLEGKEIEEYGVALGRYWGVGRKGVDDGVLILIAPNDRQMRIEVGYGLEDSLTDAIASQIINNIMLPLVKQGKYAEALIAGSKVVAPLVRDAKTKPEEVPFEECFIKVLFFWLVVLSLWWFCILYKLIKHPISSQSDQITLSKEEKLKALSECIVARIQLEQEPSANKVDTFCRLFSIALALFILLIRLYDPITIPVENWQLNQIFCGITFLLLICVVYNMVKCLVKPRKKAPIQKSQITNGMIADRLTREEKLEIISACVVPQAALEKELSKQDRKSFVQSIIIRSVLCLILFVPMFAGVLYVSSLSSYLLGGIFITPLFLFVYIILVKPVIVVYQQPYFPDFTVEYGKDLFVKQSETEEEKTKQEILSKCIVPQTLLEKELSNQDRRLFIIAKIKYCMRFFLFLFPIFLFGCVVLYIQLTSGEFNFGPIAFCCFPMVITYSLYRKEIANYLEKHPYFPYQAYLKEQKERNRKAYIAGSSYYGSSDGGSDSSSSSSSSGGDFGGGGASGRW